VNSFLHKIGIKASDKCFYVNEKETIRHFILNCQGYQNAQLLDSLMTELEKESHDSLKVLLNEDRPPPQKRKISYVLSKALKKRKTE
jgi:hypothetical protein